ncbi:MAG: response regulator transcription factor, partial [Myxococcales bacterium]|nr:response regulator transcription factor [Myxococcales bacterium]
MKVLLADDDPVSAAVMEAILSGAGHECIVAENGDAAWAIAQADDAPQIMFVDWEMPGIDGIELCRRIRALNRPVYTYVAMISVRAKQQDIAVGLEAGADDFITKPYQAQQVLARLMAAERRIRAASASPSLRQALAEARESAGGDLIVRSGDIVGRIMFHRGRVAWAHISNQSGSLHAMLATEPSITRDEIDAILEESTETGASFAEIIVDWDLLSAEQLRELVGRWLRGKIAAILRLPRPETVFSPRDRTYGSTLLFDLAELMPEEEDALPLARTVSSASAEVDTGELVPEASEALGANLDAAIAIEGARSAVVFDGRTGLCLGARGLPADLDLAWLALKLATADDGDDVEDILISGRQHVN